MKPNLALVTGASSGIGRALCDKLAAEGIDLIIHGRDLNRLEEAAGTLRSKVNVQIIRADLADPKERKVVIELIHQRLPDLVVNNAGFGLYNEAINYPVEAEMEILEVNGMALLELTLETAKTLKAAKRKGIIMNVSSVAGFFVFPGSAVYAASKSFVNYISQSLDYELKKDGVRVLAACPGMVDTGFRVRAGGTPLKERKGIMTSEYAANQIWKQIMQLKPLHIFDWKYRLAVFAQYIIPKSIYVKILMKRIKSRT